MMMIGLIAALAGLAVAYAYSTIVGALLFLAGVGLLARGYYRPEPQASAAPQNYGGSGPVTYNIPSHKNGK